VYCISEWKLNLFVYWENSRSIFAVIRFLSWSVSSLIVLFFHFGSVSLWMKISLSVMYRFEWKFQYLLLCVVHFVLIYLVMVKWINVLISFVKSWNRKMNDWMCWFCNTQVGVREKGIPTTFVPYLAMNYFDRFLSNYDMKVTEKNSWYFIKFLFLSRFLC
jgi:hypothetical protein